MHCSLVPISYLNLPLVQDEKYKSQKGEKAPAFVLCRELRDTPGRVTFVRSANTRVGRSKMVS